MVTRIAEQAPTIIMEVKAAVDLVEHQDSIHSLQLLPMQLAITLSGKHDMPKHSR